MASKAVPTCTRCGRRHYNIQTCDDAERKERLSRPVLRPRANDWGDRTSTIVKIAPNVTGQRRAPLHEATGLDRRAAA